MDPGSEGFFSSAATVLWLTQLAFLPAVVLDRASFPAVALMLGAGLLGAEYAVVTLPIAAVIGVGLICLTKTEDGDSVTLLNVQGFGGPVSDTATTTATEDPNRNRLVACTYLTPALALTYLVSSWHVRFQYSDDEASIAAWNSA